MNIQVNDQRKVEIHGHSDEKITIEATVGFRNPLPAHRHKKHVAQLFNDYLGQFPQVRSVEIAIDYTAERFSKLGSESREYRYQISFHTTDVLAVASKLAGDLSTWTTLVGNVVIRMNSGRIVLIVPGNRQSRHIRTHSRLISKTALLIPDQSIEVYQRENMQQLTTAA